MNPKFIEFNGKHPATPKDKRVYYDHPRKSWKSYGASYAPGISKLDVDDYDHKTGELIEPIRGKPRSDAVIALLDFLKIPYNAIQTEHGKQFFLLAPPDMERKHKINWYCALGIKAEWKFPESDDHIPLVINGIERKFIRGSLTNNNIGEFPIFLLPMQKSKNKPFDLDFPKGDRTQKLGAYVFYLVSKGFTAEQAFKTIRFMNQFVFEEPIPEDILNAQILNGSTLKKAQEQQQTRESKNLSQSDLAKEIIERFNLITVNGDFYSYESGVYKPFSGGKITQYLTENYPNANSNTEREVIRHISGLTYTEVPDDDSSVNVKNGILKFDPSGIAIFCPHSLDHISFKQFNALYDPTAQSKLLDDTLNLWFENSSKQIELFEQLLGYLLMNHVNYQKIFFFIGAPSTGKTTLLKLVTEFCGRDNVSAIQLDDMNRPFGLAPIVNKVANIFSDIRKTKVLKSDVFKMLADGSPIQVNRKFKQEFTYCFTGKMLFGMNSYPDFSQDFDGIERRVVIFEFKHVFQKDDPQFDPAILDKLLSDESMSALLNKAIRGYSSLIHNNGFITTDESKRALEDFSSDNDNVLKWLRDNEIDEERLLNEPINFDYSTGLYSSYRDFCFSIGEEPKAQKDFSRTICNRYGWKTATKRFNGKRPQFFKQK